MQRENMNLNYAT